MNWDETEVDDLTIIKGIGPVRQEALRRSLHVRTLRDLSQLSADEVRAGLEDEGQIISISEIEGWLTEAEELSGHEAAETNTGPAPSEASSEAAQNNEDGSPVSEEAWTWLKAFIVEFCLRQRQGQADEQILKVYPMKISETGDWLENGVRKRKPALLERGERLYPWMVERIVEQFGDDSWHEPSVSVAADEETSPSDVPGGTPLERDRPVGSAPLSIEIERLRIHQPAHSEVPAAEGDAQHPFVGLVAANSPLAIEVTFTFSAPTGIDNVAEDIDYYARFYARNMTTGARTALGDSEVKNLDIRKSVHNARLDQITMAPGRYYLVAQVVLRTKPPIATHVEVPMLQIVPSRA